MGTPVIAQSVTYTAVNAVTAAALATVLGASRCIAAYRPIIGMALGSIIAPIMIAHAATKVRPSASVGVIAISMPAMSCSLIGIRSIASQETAVTPRSAAYVTRVARPDGANTQSPITIPPATLMAWPGM